MFVDVLPVEHFRGADIMFSYQFLVGPFHPLGHLLHVFRHHVNAFGTVRRHGIFHVDEAFHQLKGLVEPVFSDQNLGLENDTSPRCSQNPFPVYSYTVRRRLRPHVPEAH